MVAVGEPRKAVDASDGDVRAQLGALSTLMFAVAPQHPAHAQAERLNAVLRPVREHARAALRTDPSPDALARCWELVGEAGATIDPAGWWLQRGDSTRAWTERFVARSLRAAASRPPVGRK